jgi:hypothetical protein
MGTVPFDFKGKSALSLNPNKIDEIGMPSPIDDLIFRVKVVKVAEERPPYAFQKQTFTVAVPSPQAASSLPGSLL